MAQHREVQVERKYVMDGQRFDRLTRSLAVELSRRRLLRGIVGTTAATATLAHVGDDWSAAARKTGPDPCAAFCAGQPGARGAQCRQACKACGSDPAAVCVESIDGVPVFTCCPSGEQCYSRTTMNGERANICCWSPEQTCRVGDGLACCEPGLDCCWNPGALSLQCDIGCLDPCGGGVFSTICGTPDEQGFCAGVIACWHICWATYVCGEPDELGNCPGSECPNPGAGA
jgi:hypothetical protein